MEGPRLSTRKMVAIVDIDSGINSEALRHTLEDFGYFVIVYGVGRPQDLIDILQGNTITKFDFIIISCHGEENGDLIMWELGEDIYFPDEPRGNYFGFNEVNKYLALTDTCIIGLGCYLGHEDMAKAFAKNNNIYIAPTDAVDSGGLVFTILFFYYLSEKIYSTQCGFDIETAYKKASAVDAMTGSFILRKQDTACKNYKSEEL